jgi:hypothetical protein
MGCFHGAHGRFFAEPIGVAYPFRVGLIAAPIPVGMGVDTDSRVSPYVAKVLRAAGKGWIGRYLPLPGNSPVNDLSSYELISLTDAGFSVGAIQHVRSGHWDPKSFSGKTDAISAVTHALSVGYPLGCHLYLDLESMSGLAADAIAFANDWAETVRDGGYRAGLYSGFDVTLTPDQLFHALTFDSYWTAAGNRHVSVRGAAIKQGLTLTIAGVGFDVDTIAPDALGELPYGCVASAVAA